jgi:hypothetical protein
MRPIALLGAVLAACTTPSPSSTDLDTDPKAPVDTDDGAVIVSPTEDTGATATGDVRITVELEDPVEQYPEGDLQPRLLGRVTVLGASRGDLVLTMTSDLDGVVSSPELLPDGRFEWSTHELQAGVHQLTLDVTHPGSGADGTDTVELGVCRWPAFEDFTTDPTGGDWTVFGDAYWDPQGWLEITGNAESRAGSIYKTNSKVNPGDFRLEFSIATGGGINTGADGFSVNVVDVPDLPALVTYINSAGNGGCLGYGVELGCGTGDVNAFHVEIDTWYNGEYADPPENHIAINFDGDPSAHVLWAPTPGLEDLAWRDIVVQARAQRLTMDIDGVRVIDSVLPGFTFDGGYIGVSGSTGWATNYHRFDNLQIYDRCLVPY